MASDSSINSPLDHDRNDSMSQKPAFECFGKLPEHLRAKIYEYICSVPRIVDVQESYRGLDSMDGIHAKCAIISETRAPAILHVSRKARKYALTRYTA
jgi:hypothetical protein